jgi:hypothetical protein
MHDATAEYRQDGDDVLDGLILHLKIILRQDRNVGELPDTETALLAVLRGEPGAAFCPQAQRRRPIELVALVIELKSADRASGAQPGGELAAFAAP